MKYSLLILTLSVLYIGCNPAPDGLNHTENQTEQTEVPPAPPIAEKEIKDPNLISSTIKMVKNYNGASFSKDQYKKDRDFEAFFKRFCDDTVFCKNSSILPYKEQVFDIENDAGETKITTNLYKKFPYHFNGIKQNKDYHITIEGVCKDTASVMINLDDTGVMIQTIFVKRNKQWFALETKDFST
jgi:hypothetical protein